VIVVTQRDDRMYAEEAFRAGASGYVLKQSAASELLVAVREVLAGNYFVTASLAGAQGGSKANPGELFGPHLTPRQREVLQLVAEGKSVKEMAHILRISPKTVEYHKAALMQELGYRTTAELTRYAVDQGIVQRAQ
jgi:DNA-binding NarL/FixJ family response regulator